MLGLEHRQSLDAAAGPALSRTAPILAALAAACASSPTLPARRAARPVLLDAAPPASDAGEPEDDAPAPRARVSEPPPLLSLADCRAFDAAPALGVAVVVASEPDCSSVGHERIVLEVQRLVRGAGIALVGASRPLGSNNGLQLEVGDTVLVAIEPETQPAEMVHCVSLPERQGSVRHVVKIDSIAASEPLLDALMRGRGCDP